MTETHPFGPFVPAKAEYLLLGSFTTKEAYDTKTKTGYQWFYSNSRNQFWPILEAVYGVSLQTRREKEQLFTSLRMALADIIYQCERRKNSNLDVNLTNIVYAIDDITKILETNDISTIFFSSRFVENIFRRIFKQLIAKYPAIKLITLPSPSPRYTQMTKDQKIERYKELLPRQN